MQPSILSPNNHTAALSVEEMNEIIDLDRYPIHDLDSPKGAELIAECQRSLDQTAASICHGFLREGAVKRLIAEMTGLLKHHFGFRANPAIRFQTTTRTRRAIRSRPKSAR